jgi:hypothetical protein
MDEKQMYNERFAYEDVFTLANTKEAVKYIGQEGYFADDYETLASRVELNLSHELDTIYPNQVQCFNSSEGGPNSMGGHNYGLFLPEDRVRDPEPEEPKYRPFTIEEFKGVFKVGEVITYREDGFEITCVITSIETISDTQIYVCLGNRKYDIEFLFNNAELLDNGQWVPFGVQDY